MIHRRIKVSKPIFLLGRQPAGYIYRRDTFLYITFMENDIKLVTGIIHHKGTGALHQKKIFALKKGRCSC